MTKGNTLKQGDKTPLKYRLFDADGEKLNIAGKSAKVRLVYPDFLTIGYEKDGLTVAQDDTVTFTIDRVVPSRVYHVEIIVDDQFVFPSRADESKFTVDKSSLGTEANIIEIVGVDQIVNTVLGRVDADINQAITDINTTNDAIQQAEQERVQGYQEIKQIIEDEKIDAIPADGSVTDEKLSNSLHKRMVEGLINIPNTLNLVHPDNFTQAWSPSSPTTIELSNNVARINLDTGSNYFYARARLPINILETPDVGDVLYVRLKLNAIDVQNVVWLAVSYNSHNSQSRVNINAVTGYQSGVFSYNPLDGRDNEYFYIKSQLQEGTSATIEVSEMMVINLTKMYGAGKEPSQAEFDDYLASNDIDYWESYQEINLLQMVQETRDLVDNFEAPVQKEQKLENMMWTWHTTPMAIYSEKSQKTFVGGVMRGATKNLNGHMIYSIDELTGEIIGNQVSNRFAGDDHNMVAFAELPWRDEVIVFYAGHSGDGIYYKYMRNYDVNDLSQEYMIPNSVGSTYINIHHSQQSNTLYLTSRVTSVGSYAIYWTDDFGITWQHRQFTTGNVYLDAGKRRRRDDKMGITLSGHGGTGFPEIYYCYLTLAGTVHLPDGTQIADVKSGEGLPLERTDLKLVATNPDSKTTVTSVKGHDDRLTFIHAPDEDNFETFNYKYAIYNPTTDEFDIYDIMTGARGNLSPESHPHYVGSTCDVGFNNAHIYSSNYNPQTQKWEIWEHAARSNRPDNGWNITKMAESNLKLFRPITVMYDSASIRKPIPGFWLKGYFTHYEDYFTEAVMPFGIDENFE